MNQNTRPASASAAPAASASSAASAAQYRFRPAFMTLGCPGWDLDTVIRRAVEYGFSGIDFRGLKDDLDITTLPAFTTQAPDTKRRLDDAGLTLCTISSSLKVCDPQLRDANLEEAKRTIAVAQAFAVGRVRVFGGGPVPEVGHQQAARYGIDMMNDILALPGARAVRWLFETHDHWIRSTDCRLLLEAIDDPAFGALWDIGHTARVGGETPEQTYAALGARVGYLHLKDAVHDPAHSQAMADGWRYVPVGTGDLPLRRGLELLAEAGYDGWLTFEHEKRWHPELPEPEVVFPAFMEWFSGLSFR